MDDARLWQRKQYCSSGDWILVVLRLWILKEQIWRASKCAKRRVRELLLLRAEHFRPKKQLRWRNNRAQRRCTERSHAEIHSSGHQVFQQAFLLSYRYSKEIYRAGNSLWGEMEFPQRAVFRWNCRDNDRLRQIDAWNLFWQIVVHFLLVRWHSIFRFSHLDSFWKSQFQARTVKIFF